MTGAIVEARMHFFMQQHLDYEHLRPRPTNQAVSSSLSSRNWAWVFLLSGGYALACIPGVLLFERLGWPDDLLNLTSFFSCLICLGGAWQYLLIRRAEGNDGTSRDAALVILARIAVGLTVAFVLFFVVVVILWMVTMHHF